ncbi:hypothetical protein K440DRAFT_636318 [Wilcoxina mikolae CBS 423.85]|nr:hypothetical protein K440DRAFT_636318 [Wilcoxina mikolae CBS 423.85]
MLAVAPPISESPHPSTTTSPTSSEIKPPGSQRTRPPSSSSPSPTQPLVVKPDNKDDDDEDEEIHTRLRHRRLELDHEIEEFKTRKGAEYRRFEESLWAEARAKRKPKDNSNSSKNNNHSTTGEDNNSHQVPIDLVGSLVEEKLKDTLREASPSTPPLLKSPPFEKELQVAGLFAPCYLPLLEDRRRDPPPPLSPTELAMGAADNSSSPKSAGSPESPAVPLASSLKSSSGSYFDSTGGGRSGRKPKSPKKVTFQFDDENSVPSRSSPPPTKIVWSFGGTEDEDDYEEVEDDASEELHMADASGPGAGYDNYSPEDRSVVQQVENVAMPTATFFPISGGLENLGHFPRSHGDQLVTPLAFGTFGADNGSGAATVSPDSNISPKAENWTSQLNSSPTNGNMGMTDDDDDDALFDLDETVPDEPQQTPPHRDLSPLIEAAMAAQQLPASTNDFSLPSPLRASYAAAVPLPGSLDPISFGKSPLTSTGFQQKYTSAFSASFTLGPKQPDSRSPAIIPSPVASSLPATSMWGFASPRPENGRFRRRSINKYIPSPPPEEETSAVRSPETIPEDAPISPFGTSMPVTITPRLSSLRSPPASTSPLNHSPAPPPTTTLLFDTAEELAATEASLPHSSEVDSYLRTARFPSASGGMMSPYRTKFAQELAQQALLDGDDVGESIVGGVDGRTGLDPESFSVKAHHGRNTFASPGAGVQGGKRWSLSARMAEEDEIEARARGGL